MPGYDGVPYEFNSITGDDAKRFKEAFAQFLKELEQEKKNDDRASN